MIRVLVLHSLADLSLEISENMFVWFSTYMAFKGCAIPDEFGLRILKKKKAILILYVCDNYFGR